MKVRLFDILDLTRPLAKAARDFDWTEVVSLFPDAHREGMSAAKIWILASIVVLSEITGLSEGEVLVRWPENPYWQAFSGFEHFQWQPPVTPEDCVAFKRFINPQRIKRLTQIASSVRDSKTLDAETTAPIPAETGTSGDETLALRQVHFLQPLPAAPYKAPPRPDFQSSIKTTYAKASAAPKPATNSLSPNASGKTPPSGASPTPSGEGKDAQPTSTPATEDPKAKENNGSNTDQNDQGAKAALADAGSPLEKPQEPMFVQTYAQMFRRKGIVVDETPKTRTQAFGAPALQEKPTIAPGSPEFDTTAPLVLRVPPGEPTRMEVAVSGEAPLRYQWEQWDDIKGVSIPIEGCTESSLTVALEPEDSMLAFQCRVSNRAAPGGIVSRTFFIKKGTSSQKNTNSFGEKFDPRMFGLNG
jgi:hypothetical protein